MRFIFVLDITGSVATQIKDSLFLFNIVFPVIFDEAVVLSFSEVITFNVVFFTEGFLFSVNPFDSSVEILSILKLYQNESGRAVFEINHV